MSHPYDGKSDVTSDPGMPPIPLPPPPRSARFKTSVKVIAVFVVLIDLGVNGLVNWIMFGSLTKLEHLRDHGVLVRAEVIDKTTSRGRKSTTYRLHYKFRAEGGEHTANDSVSKDDYANFEVGDEIPVTYMKGNPTENQPFAVDDGTVHRHKRLMWAICGVVFTTGFVLLAVFGYIYSRRLKLATDGELVSAKITEVGNPKGKNRQRKVSFDVQSPTEGPIQRSHWLPENVITTAHLGRTTGYLILDGTPKKGEPAVTVFRSCRLD